MTEAEFAASIGKLKTTKQKHLNDIFWWASLSINALENVILEDNIQAIVNIKVPSNNISGVKNKTVKRTVQQATEILQKARSIDMYYSVFVFVVAQVEDFLSQIVFMILKNDQRRIKSGVAGVDMLKKFDVDDILNSNDKEQIVEKIIKQNLINLFYAGPVKQKEYFIKVLGIEVDDALWDAWFEIKASRDIIVHNSGVINALYINKSGLNSRGVENSNLIIDGNYFSTCIAKMKSFIGKCTTSAKKSLVPQKPEKD